MDDLHSASFVSPELWHKIPAEIWVKILQLVQNPSQPKPTAERRQVCKMWKNVIDHHLDFELRLSDTNLADVSNFAHVRIKRCVVKNLLNARKAVNRVNLGKSPVTKELFITGKITCSNFDAVVSRMPNLETLSISDSVLYGNEDILSIFNQERKSKRCLQLRNLQLTILSSITSQTTSGLKIVSTLLSLKFPNLTKFELNLHLRELQFQNHKSLSMKNFCMDLFAFLQKSDLVKQVRINLRSLILFDDKWGRDESVTNFPQLKLNQQFDVFELEAPFPIIYSWLPTLRAQQKLKKFKVVDRYDFLWGLKNLPEEKLCLFDSVQENLVSNQFTLTSVNLTNVCSRVALNAVIFKNMDNLKTLVISILNVKEQKRVMYNLNALPDSLENLELHGVGGIYCPSNELLEMAEKLIRIRKINLVEFHAIDESTENVTEVGINQRILTSLVTKPFIKLFMLSYLSLDNIAHVTVNGKMFCECENNLLIELKGKTPNLWIRHSFEK